MNNKVRVAISDDELLILNLISESVKTIFKGAGIEAEITSYQRVLDLKKEMAKTSFDLLLLDIDMPELNGIDFSKDIRANQNDVEIIFISNREDLVFDCFQVHPFGFVRKSSFLSDVSTVLNSFIKTRLMVDKKQSRALVTNVGKGSLAIPLDTITYIECFGKTQNIYVTTQKEPYEVHTTMASIEEQIKNAGFYRIHKGYIVNFMHLRYINGVEAVMADKTTLPISRNNTKESKKAFLEYLQEKNTSMQ